jgi:hypothetical protein
MERTYKERILDYLWAVAPGYATNGQIREGTGIHSHQQVYMLTQELMHSHLIRGERHGREWLFRADESPAVQPASPRPALRAEAYSQAVAGLSARAFEEMARSAMSSHFGGLALTPQKVRDVPKLFDMVSEDQQIVGDAKYFVLVRGERRPPAKFSVIAEHVWLLEKTGAPVKFLVFGNDRRVPLLWLQSFGALAAGVDFYFLPDGGELEQLSKEAAGE